MLYVSPSYYKNFICTASHCRDNCCRVDWEIALDRQTYDQYRNAAEPFRSKLLSAVSESDGKYCISRSHGACPLLRDDGLCEVVLTLGEEYLGFICRTHPRYINPYSDREEIGIGLACEEAARLIMTDPEPGALDMLGSPDKSVQQEETEAYLLMRQNMTDFIAGDGELFEKIAGVLKYAEEISNCLSAEELSAKAKEKIKPQSIGQTPCFENISEIVQKFLEYEILDSKWINVLNSLCIDLKGRSARDNSHTDELSRIFIYFLYRYFVLFATASGALFAVKFAVVSTVLLRELFVGKSFDERVMLAHMFSKEIEYSDENLDDLRLDMFVDEVFEIPEIMKIL